MTPSTFARLIAFVVLLVTVGCAAPSEEAAQPPRASGTEPMVQRLEAIARDTQPQLNEYMNRERLAALRQLSPPPNLQRRARFEFQLASELLRAGHSEEAIDRLDRLFKMVRTRPAAFPPDLPRHLRSLRAVAHLRLGEQENCLAHHTAEACLLPLSDAAVHRQQRGSRAAMEELADLLREDPDDLESRWLYNLAAMTVGEHPESVPEEWLIPSETFASEHDIGRFVDAAAEAGLATMGLAGGVVLDDLDGDGHLDVMVSSWGLTDPLRFFRNLGISRGDRSSDQSLFEERTREAGLEGIVSGLNMVHADYDNDGDADVLVLRGAWLTQAGRHPNSLLRNNGMGADGNVRFEDVTEQAGLLNFHPTQTAAWGDYDNDGWIDLFIGNESLPGDSHPCQLFRNNGPGRSGEVTFTDVATEAGVAAGGYVKGVVWGDIDNDGWIDLYLSRLLEPNLLFHNQGGRRHVTFRESAEAAGVTEPENSFPAWFFDYDNDGWIDLFVSSYSASYVATRPGDVAADYLGLPTTAETPRLYRNRGDGSFADVTVAAGLDRVLLAMGANFGDLDNDGWIDFYLATGGPDFRALMPNRMFRNDSGRGFQDVTTSGGFGHLQKGHGVAFADIDNDGDQDVFAVMGGAFSGDAYPNVLFTNPGHGHPWITLRLEGTTSNRSAIGARIRVELETPHGPRQVYATVGTGGSFGSSSLQQEIGLGDALAIRTVEVSWPGGKTQSYRDLPMNRAVHLREGELDSVVVELDQLDIAGSTPHG